MSVDDTASSDDLGAIRAALDRARELGGDALVHKLIELFLKITPTKLEELDLAVTDRNASAIAACAHYLKSSTAQMGANRMADLAKALELDGRQGRLENAHAQAAEIGAAYRLAVPLFISFLATK